MSADYPRDLIGYGSNPPHPHWPGKARIALSFVLNYEEGGERNILHGDKESEAFLSEMVSAQPLQGARNMSMESLYEYGSRAGVWRILKLFKEFDIPLTIFAVAMAAQRHPDVIRAMVEAGHEICSHGYRWIDYQYMDEAQEREHMLEAIRILTELTGERPLGWYTGRTETSPGAANGSRHNATTVFCHMAACTAGTRPELARLFSDSSENSNPEATDHNSPSVAWLARSKLGVTRISPTLTRTTRTISLRRMRSRKISPSRITVNAGKLAKPRVAIATPAIFTETKKLTQCPASSKPLSSTIKASNKNRQERCFISVSPIQSSRLQSGRRYQPVPPADQVRRARPYNEVPSRAGICL